MLVRYEHQHTLIPSSLAVCYTIVKIIFDGAIIRTYDSMGFSDIARPTFITLAVSMGAYFLVLVTELIEKRRLFLPKYQVRR